jgi:tRNA(Ile)-lysidine synthase TilS/MesJ
VINGRTMNPSVGRWHAVTVYGMDLTDLYLGLAISGGVDSMALATLYSTALKSPTGSHLPQCHGIIIDHKFRPESTEEAKWVSEQLKSGRKPISHL